MQNMIGNSFTLNILEKITGSRILKKMPIGLDLINDINKNYPNYSLLTIIDVGANVGQSENDYVRKNPNTAVYCIEPVGTTFLQLQKNIKGNHTKCFQYAFGEETSTVQMKVSKSASKSVSNSILIEKSIIDSDFEIEEVKMITLDAFCQDNNINAVSLLKIDAEGYDLNVLKGGINSLQEQKIDFIEVEVSMNETNVFHVNYFEIYNFLKQYNYFVFGIYEQMPEFVLKQPQLRRSNVVFISKKMVEKYPN